MILDDIATYLAAQSTAISIHSGTAGNLGKSISLDSASVPDTFISLYEVAGLDGARAFSTGAGAERLFDRPRIQIITRSTSYQTARNLAQTVYNILDGIGEQALPTSTGTKYLSITAVQPPFSIGRDANDRFLTSTNYQCERDQ